MAKIKCTECGYENEPERIYCHNCGVKLDRSLLPADDKKPTQKSVQRRVKKLTTPTKRKGFGAIGSLISTLIWAAFVAAIIQALRPPEEVPTMPDSNLVESAPLAAILDEAVDKGTGEQIRLPEQSLNDYLFNAVRSKPTGPLKDYLKFDRAFVNPRKDGIIEITVQHSILGHPIYMTTFYTVRIDDPNDRIIAKNQGGRYGSLLVHPLLMPLFEHPIRKLWTATTQEKRVIERLQAVEVNGDSVIVTAPRNAPAQ